MTETLDRPSVIEADTNRIHRLFIEKTLLRLEAMRENFESGSWSTPTKKALVSNAFNIKNEGYALGYLLLARTAESFCDYADKIRYPTDNQRIVMEKHLETMQSVATNNIEGAGGEIGIDLFRHLQLLVEKFQE